jgi:hypothetical protein
MTVHFARGARVSNGAIVTAVSEHPEECTGVLMGNPGAISRDGIDFSGFIVVGGRDYRLTAQQRTRDDGRRYWAVRLKPKADQQ